jgi:4-hydroxy-tetrahydrodipicolinate reductase
LIAAAAQTARLLRSSGASWDAHIVETHHATKKDAPSGTALAIQQAMVREWGGQVPVTSIRVGAVPGTHEVIFDGTFDQLRLEHVARDRRVFADGALAAAAWLVGRSGIFTLQDMIHQAHVGAGRDRPTGAT